LHLLVVLMFGAEAGKPEAPITYDGGEAMTEPWTMLALINATCDIVYHSLVTWPQWVN